MVIVPFFLVMKTLGLLNSSLSLIIVYSVTTIPLCVFMLKSYFDSIPYALEEAAQLDGCSQIAILWRISAAIATGFTGDRAFLFFVGLERILVGTGV